MHAEINYAWAIQQLGGKVDREILCPECSASRKPQNRKKPTFGLHYEGDGKITYNCQNCHVRGVVTESWEDKRQPALPRASAEVIPLIDGKPDWPGRIWLQSEPPDGTIVIPYWRARFGDQPVPIPRSVRFHPALKPDAEADHKEPCLILAYGFDGRRVEAIHRVFLKPDGSWHTGVKKAGGGHMGLPMIVHRNPEASGLVIAEGPEKALAAAFVLNLDGWASGGVSFMPALADAVPAETESVTIIVDKGPDPERYAGELAAALAKRGIECRAVRLPADPDDILCAHGADALRGAIDDPGNIVKFEAPITGPRLLWERDALALRQPQDWLVQDILERGYLYSLTGRSGSGKTAVALLLSYLIAAPDMFPRLLGTREAEAGTVVFLAGENPVDVIRRMAGLRAHYGLVQSASIAMVDHTFSIKDHVDTIAAQIPQDRPLSLVVVDTSQAFFEGKDENTNAEMVAHARTLRRLTKLPGNPSVLVLCHPAKGALTQADMIPRGGTGFLAEIDGNLTLWSDGDSDQVFELHHTNKLRGPGFEPVKIELLKYTDTSFIDTKGRPSYTVVAKVVTEQEAETKADEFSARERAVLDAIAFATDGLRHRQIVEMTGILKGTVSKILQRLMARPPKIERDGSVYRIAKPPKNGKGPKVSDN